MPVREARPAIRKGADPLAIAVAPDVGGVGLKVLGVARVLGPKEVTCGTEVRRRPGRRGTGGPAGKMGVPRARASSGPGGAVRGATTNALLL